MIDRFRRSVFGRDVRRSDAPAPAPPKKTLEQELLEILNLVSFEQAGCDAEARIQAGLLGGWVDEIRNAEGVVIDYRPRSYSSMVEAGIDYLVAQVNDPIAAAKAKRRQPLARRHVLLQQDHALRDVPVTEGVPPPREQARVAEPVRTVVPDWSQTGNSVAMIARRRAIEAEHRDALVAQFNERSRHLIGDAAPDPNDVISARFRIDRELAAWEERYPELAEALAAERTFSDIAARAREAGR